MDPTCRADEEPRFKPGVGQILRSLGLEVSYDRGQGDFVYYSSESGADLEVLDLVAGYGTLLLGHNHPALIAEATQYLASGRPNHVQGSRRRAAEQLVDDLLQRTGRDDCVVFANSGTEAVEAAIKHAMLETSGSTFLALDGGFHGKTLGALQLTANPAFRDPFVSGGPNVVRIPPNDVARLELAFAQTSNLAGFVFEPILGEGGIRPLSREFAQRLVDLCRLRNVPSIADECQTGIGRTGTFLCSESLGIYPDYVTLSKALGGGLAKISAVLIDRRRYRPTFDFMHTSTFADDDFSCHLASKTLELINSRLLADCREKGKWLLEQLRRLRGSYPQVIADVRGAGLMIGIEFQEQFDSESCLLRQLSARKLLGALLAGYLLKAHRIRIAPTLSEPRTLRVQPSVFVSRESLQRFVDALAETCSRLENADVLRLTAHLPTPEPTPPATICDGIPSPTVIQFQPQREEHSVGASSTGLSFAWLFHLIDAHDVPNLEPSLEGASLAERNEFMARLAPLAEPMVMPKVDIRSAVGNCISLWPILLPVTSAWLKHHIETRRPQPLKRLLARSIEVAESLGADLVSLGQFTSIVSSNGRSLASSRIGLTTGNSYTTALIVEAIRQAQHERGISPEFSTLAVVGAAGNIGRACAEILAPDYQRVILVGRQRPAAQQQLRSLAQRIGGATATCELADVLGADVVVCATNCIEPVLGPDHFRSGAIVCDASVPGTLCPETAEARPDLTVFRGGIVQLPHRERLDIPGFPLPPGHAFGCLAEGAVLYFEGVRDATYTGRLHPEKIARITQLAARHGFGPPLPAQREHNLAQER